MVRVTVGLAAWIAGTASAVCVAWLGANVVVRNAGVGPGIPVINATVLPSTGAPPPVVTPPAVTPTTGVTPTASARGPATRPASGATPSASATGPRANAATASASPSGGAVHAYTLAGGDVTLDVSGAAVQLVTAVPDAGYSVETWSGTGWLRVDFNSGAKVSSLIASWYLHAPTITVTN